MAAAAGTMGHWGSCIWAARSKNEGFGQHVITELISERVKGFGSQGGVGVWVCVYDGWRNCD